MSGTPHEEALRVVSAVARDIRLAMPAAARQLAGAVAILRELPAGEIDLLASQLRAQGYPVAIDGSVDERVASAVLTKSRKTLRNWRADGSGPPYTNQGRVRYPLAGLIAFKNRT